MTFERNVKGLLGTKLGMTQVWDENNRIVPVTVVKAGPCVVTAVRTPDVDGYNAVQLGFGQIDPRKVTKPLQGQFAEGVIDRHPNLSGVDSIVFVEDPGGPAEQVAIKTDAALRVAKYLGGPWHAFRAAAVIPEPLRDRLYDGFARVRYRVFGTHDTCPIPPPEVRARFLD